MKRPDELKELKVFFATTNADKVREARAAVSAYGVGLEQAEVDVEEIKSLDILRVAERKAIDSFKLVKKPVVVDDTGYFFEAFPGFPGTYSKFCVQTIGVANAVRLLEGKTKRAYFSTVVAYCGGKTAKCFEGRTEGTVLLSPRGIAAPKLPYDPYFVPDGSEKTYGEMTLEEKNSFSHRARAFQKFGEWFVKQKRK